MAAFPVGAGPVAPTAAGLAIGEAGFVEGGRFGGGVDFSSTNSGVFTSGSGGGGANSSGGGVGCGGSGVWSIDSSTTASGICDRSSTFSLGWIEAIATAAK